MGLHEELSGAWPEAGVISRINEVLRKIFQGKKKANATLQPISLADVQQPKVQVVSLKEEDSVVEAEYTPLTLDQKRELLRPEAVSELSLEQYIELWRRLNPYFLSHVTRQGFRDHNAMMYHSEGLEEFHAGFLQIMSDERLLRSPMALGPLRYRDVDSVRAWLGKWVFEGNEDEAYLRLDRLLNFNFASAPKYPDKTAVHFAAELVADAYYGGELGNEVFFIYPTDVIASQFPFAFNGWQQDFTIPQSETKWNDIFVWTQELENAGIPIDAGIVFLPKSTKVDKLTGSKYASALTSIEGQEKRILVEDKGLIENFVSWLTNLDEQSSSFMSFQEYESERDYYSREFKAEITLRKLTEDLTARGFPEDAAVSLASEVLAELSLHRKIDSSIAETVIRRSGAHYKRAEDAVTAEGYWESYFKKNSSFRPKHIIYYDGNSTRAVHEFLREHAIGSADNSQTEGKLLGFDDNHVTNMESDPRANQGKNELLETAKQIIAEHYKHI